ncbi:type III secretion system cytoplasmic ring protein SctQ [Cupriavidus gilardii]|uniref:type III secretion system cytoplasmic ring protein SctQ n=1 Tax=Cupriavidus gilardii TaxID=82541 RepID=UPI0021BE2D69|nr:type III secretion system cytoplasmic ring protein SctQ [Cupriavidus gilardii]MCT9117844.1 type III secretion system cytoplasmic ring protein SctQ [Cupriavidus gilardii]
MSAGRGGPARARVRLHRPGSGEAAIRELDAAPELPHVEADVAALANRLLCRTAPLRLRVAGADWVLRFEPRPGPSSSSAHVNAYAFTLGETRGQLLFDVPSERRLLGVDGASETLPALLRQALMADALAQVAETVAAASRQPFAWQGDGAGQRTGAPCFGLTLRRIADGDDGGGTATDSETLHATLQLDEPERLATLPLRQRAPDAGLPPWLAQLRVPLAVRIGTTAIAVGEMRDIRPGDIVGIEQWQTHGGALAVHCTTGAAGLGWPALAEGRRITIQRPTGAPAAPSAHGDSMEDRNNGQRDLPHPDAAPAALDRLEELEVSLRFEVGDVSLALADLREVRPGYVFELPQPLKQSEVRIVAGGRILGTGTLIAVGNRLGVRVSSFAAGDA